MAHVATITIDHTKVPGDLTDYVGLIVPDGSAGYSALYALCLEGGGDIRLFKSDDTTELAREIVTFSVTDETGEIHYKYSGTLSSSVDTPIHVYADGSSADYAVSATYGRNAVWSDYQAVYHMNSPTDSAGNSNLTATSISYVSGKVGNGADFNTGTSKMQSTINSGLGGSFYVTTWVKADALTSTESWLFTSYVASYSNYWASGWFNAGPNARYALFNGTQNPFVDSSPDPVTDTWYKYTFVRDTSADTVFFFRNATLNSNVSTDTTTSIPTYSAFVLGRFFNNTKGLDGIMDEVRVRGSLFSATWETTEYNNQNSYSTFYSVAAVAGGSAAQAARRGAVMMM